MTIDILHNRIRLILNSSQSQYWSPEDIDSAINLAQTDKYRDVYAIFEATQKITDSMRNFKKTSELPVVSEGLFDIPSDYFNATNISSLVADSASTPENPLPDLEYGGKFYSDGEFLEAAESELLPPEITKIKARIISGKIQVLPKTATKIRLYYLSKPKDVVYAYDPINDKIVFKETGSVDPEWPDAEINDIIMRALKYLGIAMKDDIAIQSEQLTQQQATS